MQYFPHAVFFHGQSNFQNCTLFYFFRTISVFFLIPLIHKVKFKLFTVYTLPCLFLYSLLTGFANFIYDMFFLLSQLFLHKSDIFFLCLLFITSALSYYTSHNWWIYTGDWVAVNLLNAPALSSVFSFHGLKTYSNFYIL